MIDRLLRVELSRSKLADRRALVRATDLARSGNVRSCAAFWWERWSSLRAANRDRVGPHRVAAAAPASAGWQAAAPAQRRAAALRAADPAARRVWAREASVGRREWERAEAVAGGAPEARAAREQAARAAVRRAPARARRVTSTCPPRRSPGRSPCAG